MTEADINYLDFFTLKNMGVSVRLYNCLIHDGIHSLKDLTNVRAYDIRRMRNFGMTTARELMSLLEEHNGYLLENDSSWKNNGHLVTFPNQHDLEKNKELEAYIKEGHAKALNGSMWGISGKEYKAWLETNFVEINEKELMNIAGDVDMNLQELSTPALNAINKIEPKDIDFLQFTEISDLNASVKLYAALKITAGLDNLAEISTFSSTELAQKASLTPRLAFELCDVLEAHHGYLRENDGDVVDTAGTHIEFPNAIDLKKTGNFETYLQDGQEQVMKERGTQFQSWLYDRQRASLSRNRIKNIDFGEENHIQDLVGRKIAENGTISLVDFNATLDEISDPVLRDLSGKISAKGDVLDQLGDIALNGSQNLVEHFGINAENIAAIEGSLQKRGLSLSVRDELQIAYEEDIHAKTAAAIEINVILDTSRKEQKQNRNAGWFGQKVSQ